jgi:AcrR family transcriptional regulator
MPRGRVREFDVDGALGVAMTLFWQQGYEGTSIADLTGAMGINPPSLYAAFGSKRQLFEMAADRYLASCVPMFEHALGQRTAREATKAFLLGTVATATQPDRPAGCFNLQSALACGDGATEATELLASRRRAARVALEGRYRRGVADGDLPAGTRCAALARFVAAVAGGINIQAAEGATRSQLREVVAVAMQGFDEAVRGGEV